MLGRRLLTFGLSLFLAGGVGLTALAQTEEPAASGAPAEPAPSSAPAETTATPVEAPKKAETAPVEVIDDVPDQEKAANSATHLERMKAILARVLKHVEDAREERDVVKLNCVNEKLTAIKGLLRISEQADVSMQEALARRNSEVANHEYEKIAIAMSKCEQLVAESEACVGELAVYAGDTQVEVEITGEPPEDLSEDIPKDEIITRPPAASPYQ